MKYREINKAEKIANRIGFWLSAIIVSAIAGWVGVWLAWQVLGFLVGR